MRNRLILLAITILTITVSQPNAQTSDNNWPALEGDGTLRRIQVPILMYHYVSELPADADAIRQGLTLNPAIFEDHLQYFGDNGYTTISLYDLDAALDEGIALPEKSVILTFDDGYLDAYTEVFPRLQAFGMTGTFFIATQFIDDNNPNYMTWAQINEMAAAGMDMEGHTKTHPSLVERDIDFLVYQVVGSLESLMVHSGEIPRMFSYPGGNYDESTLRFMASTPVERAVTTQTGTIHTTTNRLELPRMRVTNETGAGSLNYLLTYRQPLP